MGSKVKCGEDQYSQGIPEISRALGMDRTNDPSYPEVVMREIQITYPEMRQLRLYAVPIENTSGKGNLLAKRVWPLS